jgi:multiple sugar transport system substrate-binding protein
MVPAFPRFLTAISLIAAALTCACLPGGCGGRNPDRTVIRMWAFPMLPKLRDREMYAEFARDFEKENPGIEVRVEMLPWAGRAQKMTTALLGGRAPDTVYLNLDFMLWFVAQDALLPLDSLLPAEERADFDPAALDAVSANGHAWLLPMFRTVTTALYNKDLFARAGLDPEKPPATWKEIENAARALTRDTDGDGNTDQWGFGFGFGGDTLNASFWPFLWQAGGEVLSPDSGRAAFDSPQGAAALRFLTRLFRDGAVPPSFLSLGGNEFAAGKVGYLWGMSQVDAQALRRDVPGLNFGVAPVPANARRMSYSTVGSYAIFRSSKHPEAAGKWLRYLTRPDNMRRFCAETGLLPTRKSVGPMYTDDSILGAFEREVPYCRPDVKHIQARQIMMRLAPELQECALGRKTPEQALKQAATDVNRILEQGQ